MKYFYNTNYSPLCLDQIKEELKNPNWFTSPYDVDRSNLSKDLKDHIQSLLPFKISDAGFLKRGPNSIYHPHIDPKRTFALNLPLTDESEESGTYVIKMRPKIFSNNIEHDIVQWEKVDYTKDHITILNVKEIHYVVNQSPYDRIILSIGCNNMSYYEILREIMLYSLKI